MMSGYSECIARPALFLFFSVGCWKQEENRTSIKSCTSTIYSVEMWADHYCSHVSSPWLNKKKAPDAEWGTDTRFYFFKQSYKHEAHAVEAVCYRDESCNCKQIKLLRRIKTLTYKNTHRLTSFFPLLSIKGTYPILPSQSRWRKKLFGIFPLFSSLCYMTKKRQYVCLLK